MGENPGMEAIDVSSETLVSGVCVQGKCRADTAIPHTGCGGEEESSYGITV